MGYESHNNTGSDRSSGTNKEKIGEIYIPQITGNIKIHELQKITLLGTSLILRKALSIK